MRGVTTQKDRINRPGRLIKKKKVGCGVSIQYNRLVG